MTISIGIFCGSKTGRNLKHTHLTKEVIKWIGSKKLNIVFGGSELGLMKIIPKEALKFNLRVYGIIPQFLSNTIKTNSVITDLIITKNLEQRKKQFLKRSDCFLVLPGGLGTLNELLDIMVKNILKENNKPIFLINDNNYWEPFLDLLNHFEKENFLDYSVIEKTIDISSFENIKKKIEKLNDKNNS